jgi:hypothetical protein
MNDLIETIRAAFCADATQQTRDAAAAAFAILTATPGAPSAPAEMPSPPSPSSEGAAATEPSATSTAAAEAQPAGTSTPSSAEQAPNAPPAAPLGLDAATIGAIIGALRGLPPEQLLDLAIARLRAALPADKQPPPATATPPQPPVRFHLVQVPSALTGKRR